MIVLWADQVQNGGIIRESLTRTLKTASDLHLRYRDKIVTVDGIALLFDEPEQNSTSSSSEPIEKK